MYLKFMVDFPRNKYQHITSLDLIMSSSTMPCLDFLQNPSPIAMVQTKYELEKSRSSNVMKVQQPESQTSQFGDTIQSFKCFAYLPVMNAASSYLIPEARHCIGRIYEGD